MLNQPTQKTIGRWTANVLILGASVLFLLLLFQSASLSNAAAATRLVAIGPVKLLAIIKAPVEGGYSASFELQSGMIAYIAFLVITIAIGSTVSLRRNTQSA